MRRIVILATALVLGLAPAPAEAQTQTELDFRGATEFYNGLGIAPYRLQVQPALGGPVIDVYCVDPHVTAHTSTYTGWVSPITLSTLQHTKNYGRTGGDPSATFETYWKTAWLATQFEALSGSNTTADRAAMQGALWEIGGMLPYGGIASGEDVWTHYGKTPPSATAISGWVSDANTAFATDPGQINASQWVVLTTAGTPDQQEFLARRTDVVPEPAVMMLLGTGLLGLFGVAYRRRTA